MNIHTHTHTGDVGVSLLFFNNKLLLLRVATDENISRPNLWGARARGAGADSPFKLCPPSFSCFIIYSRSIFISRRPVPLPCHDYNIMAVTSTHYITLRVCMIIIITLCIWYWISVKEKKEKLLLLSFSSTPDVCAPPTRLDTIIYYNGVHPLTEQGDKTKYFLFCFKCYYFI